MKSDFRYHIYLQKFYKKLINYDFNNYEKDNKNGV